MPKPKSDDAQSRRFAEAARRLGCDESEAAFDAKLKKIASIKPEMKSKKPKAPAN